MAENLDKSLDDIVGETGRDGQRRRRGGRAGGRGGPIRNGDNWVRPAPYTSSKRSFVPQMGVRRKTTATKILVENLHPGVNDADMEELFSQIGPLKKAVVHFNSAGKSLGTANIVFVRPEDAATAVREYNSLTLDGRPMKLTAVDEGGNGVAMASRIQATNYYSQNDTQPRRYGNDRGGRGGRGRRGGRGAGNSRPKTQEELDAELESYLETN